MLWKYFCTSQFTSFHITTFFWQFCPIQVLHCVNKDVQFLIKSSDKYNWIIYMICASMRIFALIFLQSISYIFAACTFLKAAAAQKEGFVFLTGNGISWHWCPSSPCEWFWQESLRLHLKLFSRQCTFWSRQYMLSGDEYTDAKWCSIGRRRYRFCTFVRIIGIFRTIDFEKDEGALNKRWRYFRAMYSLVKYAMPKSVE